jgi:flavorubredoxin
MTISRPELAIDPSKIDVSAYAPRPPMFRHEPQKIAEDTYLIRQTSGEGEAPVFAYINSMVITGQEPVIVDTGMVNNRREWLNDVFSLVDPNDVRWVFVSHDDHDHTGNLAEVLALCPNATLISSWFQVERLSGDIGLPLHRMRWLEDGDSWEAGDRTFGAIRPPVFDSPTTRGLYDSKTGVYWGSDSFATLCVRPMEDVSEIGAAEEWREMFNTVNMAVSPWIEMVDPAKFGRRVKLIEDLRPTTIVSAHTPPIHGDYVGKAIEMAYALPSAPKAQLPGQADLEAILAAIAGHEPAKA